MNECRMHASKLSCLVFVTHRIKDSKQYVNPGSDTAKCWHT
jgi:hypothetical protein